jgi:hypothetical protein
MTGIEEISSAQDPGRSIANMRLFQEVLGQIARKRIIPQSLSNPENPGTSYPGTEREGGGKDFLLDFDWHLPPSHPLEPAPSPPEKQDNPDLLAPFAHLQSSKENLENLQRVRNFSRDTVFEQLLEGPHRELLLSSETEGAFPHLVLKDSVTGDIVWEIPLQEAQDILLRGTPLKGLRYSYQG